MSINILRFVIPKSLVEYIDSDSTVRQALEKMRFHRYTALPIIDKEGRYVATIRHDDIFKCFLEAGSFDKALAEDIPILEIADRKYSPPLLHSASMNQLIDSVKEHNFVPVVDDRGCFIGIILRREVLGFLQRYFKEG